MQRWSGRVALVTGASSGIGAAIAKQLVDNGLLVVGMARRVDKIEEAVGIPKSDVTEAKVGGKGKLFAVQGDVSKEQDILAVFKWTKKNLGGVDVLVNNAGVFNDASLTDSDSQDWRRILEVNVLGLSICTQEAVKSMRERGVDDGHIIHISSIVAHVMPTVSEGSMYYASKHAVKVLTEGLRRDLATRNSKIRVTSISPGLVKTEIFDNLKTMDTQQIFSRLYIESKDVADVAIFALAAPPNVQIHDVIIRPVGEGALGVEQ